MVDRPGDDPGLAACKAAVLPLSLSAHFQIFWLGWVESNHHAFAADYGVSPKARTWIARVILHIEAGALESYLNETNTVCCGYHFATSEL